MMKKLHQQNLIIIWCSVVALSLVSVFGYGMTAMALKGSMIVIVSGIISTIGYFLPISDSRKALILALPPAIGTLFYSWVSGGNSIPYIANFVLLAMTATYFIEKVIISFAVPFTACLGICIYAFPERRARFRHDRKPVPANRRDSTNRPGRHHRQPQRQLHCRVRRNRQW